MSADSPVKIQIRRPLTPYSSFVKHYINQVYKPGGEKTMSGVGKDAAERWKAMSEDLRKPYKDIAAQDKRRYESQVASLPQGAVLTKGTKRKRKSIKDPNAPKRATTAFFFFAHDERAKVRALNPEFKVTEVSKALGRMWSEMGALQKEQYELKAVADRKRYHDQMAEYTASVPGDSEDDFQ